MQAWIRRWGPAIFIMGIIFVASSTPGPELPELGTWDTLVKKTGHIIGYALLGAAYCHALHGNRPRSWFQLAVPLCLAFLYAVSDEWHQSFVPGRSASPLDVGIDTAGIVLGVAVWYAFQRRPPVGCAEPGTRGRQL